MEGHIRRQTFYKDTVPSLYEWPQIDQYRNNIV